jgi:hypothetical protein
MAETQSTITTTNTEATAPSKKGYTYTYEQVEGNQRVITRDKDGRFIANTGNYLFPGNKTKEMLIADARKAAGDD